MPSSLVLLSIAFGAARAEWALINLIRHGERGQNDTDIHLTREGEKRSQYIAKCVGSGDPSLAFPLGPPTELIASYRPASSVRPLETLQPLAEKLGGMHIDNTIGMQDADKVAEYVQGLKPGGTLFLAWQHWFIPFLVRALEVTATELAPEFWPNTCPYHEWDEPDYTSQKPSKHNPSTAKACYDVLWQVVLFRENDKDRWRAQAFTQMHMGFGGESDSPCESGFKPNSNPTNWAKVQGPSHEDAKPEEHDTKKDPKATVLLAGAPVLTGAPEEATTPKGSGVGSMLAAAAGAAALVAVLVVMAYEGPHRLYEWLARMSGRAPAAEDYHAASIVLDKPLIDGCA